MTRKPDTATNSSAQRTAASLKSYRAQIDKLDLQILRLINARADLAAKIGRLKSEQGAEIFSPGREEEVLQNVLRANRGPLEETTIRAVFREIMSGSRALQRVTKVAFLGPEYSYSHLAAIKHFGQTVEYIPVNSIMTVFEEVNRRHANQGVVPLENSTDGRVADSLDMFLRLPHLRICGEIRLRIHHNLLANCEQLEIRRIYSKPQALSQCRNWLSKNVPHASLHEVASTSDAAKLALGEPGAAAVASHQASVRYGLRVLCRDIEDSPYNETRFAVLSLQECARTGQDKTSVMFQLVHSTHPGTLADALQIVKQNKVNLTWIESFPFRSTGSEYVFFADFEGHTDEPKIKRTLAALQEHCERLSVLGSYPIAPVIES